MEAGRLIQKQVKRMKRPDSSVVRQIDPNGWLEMPGGRTAVSPDACWYHANNPSKAVPTGRGDEDAIRAVWAKDAVRAKQ